LLIIYIILIQSYKKVYYGLIEYFFQFFILKYSLDILLDYQEF